MISPIFRPVFGQCMAEVNCLVLFRNFYWILTRPILQGITCMLLEKLTQLLWQILQKDCTIKDIAKNVTSFWNLPKVCFQENPGKTFILSNFSCRFLNPNIFFPIWILIRSEKLLGTSIKSILFQKLVWPFTVRINCYNDLKNLANSWPSASIFKS